MKHDVGCSGNDSEVLVLDHLSITPSMRSKASTEETTSVHNIEDNKGIKAE